MPNSNTTNSQADETWVPDGFVWLIGANNQMYVIPEHCLPDLDQIHLSNKKKDELSVSNAQGTVSLLKYSLVLYRYDKGQNGYVRSPVPEVPAIPAVCTLPAINSKGPGMQTIPGYRADLVSMYLDLYVKLYRARYVFTTD